MTKNYEIAAYYFPNYHVDPKNETRHGSGWTEWELVKRATPRFEGHRQPKVPLWGYEDEADPVVMAQKIDAAADHGLTSFIFDWYWYEDSSYLERALNEGFLQAANNDRIQFALMWANHDWVDLHPAKRLGPWTQQFKGVVTPESFRAASSHIVSSYFSHPSYWRVNGGLYFSFYDVNALVAGFGSVEATRQALDSFRQQVRDAWLGELHLNGILRGKPILPGETRPVDFNELFDRLGFDSANSYVWLHHTSLNSFPFTDYGQYRAASAVDYEKIAEQLTLPYFPNVTMGWDPSPRTIQSDVYEKIGYPYTEILQDNTPEQFEMALRAAKDFLDEEVTRPNIIIINAWNEWTEGSYLEPDTHNGTGYLKAIRHVFAQCDHTLSYRE